MGLFPGAAPSRYNGIPKRSYEAGAARVNIAPETEYVEHKESTTELDAACTSIAAMLNKHGRGEVFFGVLDNGDVKGQDAGKQTLHKVTQRIEQRVEPRIAPTVEALKSDDGRTYIRVAFEGSEAPYSCTGRYRIRVSDEDKAMTAAQVEEAFRACEPPRPLGRAPLAQDGR